MTALTLSETLLLVSSCRKRARNCHLNFNGCLSQKYILATVSITQSNHHINRPSRPHHPLLALKQLNPEPAQAPSRASWLEWGVNAKLSTKMTFRFLWHLTLLKKVNSNKRLSLNTLKAARRRLTGSTCSKSNLNLVKNRPNSIASTRWRRPLRCRCHQIILYSWVPSISLILSQGSLKSVGKSRSHLTYSSGCKVLDLNSTQSCLSTQA